jgi:hypothetical protein
MKAFKKGLLGILAILSVVGAWADDHTPTVENGLEPEGAAVHLVLEETLRVGDDGENDEMLWVGSQISVVADDRGHIFVVDRPSNRIIELNQLGEFVRQIGKPGQGPGEFQNLANFQVFEDGSGRATQHMGLYTTIYEYDDQLAYVNQHQIGEMSKMFISLSFDQWGKKALGGMISMDQTAGEMTITIALVDNQFEVLKRVHQRTTQAFNPGRMSDPEYWVEHLARQFEAGFSGDLAHVAFDSKGNIYTSPGDRYVITKWDSDLKEQRIIKKEYKRKPYTQAEIDAVVNPIHEAVQAQLPAQLKNIVSDNVVRRALDRVDLSVSKLPVNGLLIVDDYLIVVHELNLATNIGNADLFDPSGRYVGSFEMNALALPKLYFRDGKAYTVNTSDDEENEVVRYDYRFEQGKGLVSRK